MTVNAVLKHPRKVYFEVDGAKIGKGDYVITISKTLQQIHSQGFFQENSIFRFYSQILGHSIASCIPE